MPRVNKKKREEVKQPGRRKKALKTRFQEHVLSPAEADNFDQFSKKGQAAVVSFTNYGYAWLRFRNWMAENYPRMISLNVDIEGGDPSNIFKSIRLPIDIKVAQEYLMYLKDGNNLGKTAKLIGGMASESTPKGFINALSHAYRVTTGKPLPRLVYVFFLTLCIYYIQ